VHGDDKPQDILVKRSPLDHFVVADFDSVHDTGSMLMFKAGDCRWTKNKRLGEDIAEEDDDWYSFRKLQEWLIRETGGRKADFQGSGKILE
jgi:hypothetical protein